MNAQPKGTVIVDPVHEAVARYVSLTGASCTTAQSGTDGIIHVRGTTKDGTVLEPMRFDCQGMRL